LKNKINQRGPEQHWETPTNSGHLVFPSPFLKVARVSQLDQDKLADAVVHHARRDYTVIRDHQTVGQAIESLRSEKLAEKIVYFYVLDGDDKLAGVVPTRRLLMSESGAKISDIMVSRVISIPDTMTLLDACEFFVMHRLLAFPVVDKENRLVGVVDVSLFTDEMFDVSEQQSSQDVFQLIGVHIALGRRGSPWAGFRSRFPWLLCNVGGGLACAFIAGMYEAFLDTVFILALFIPVVLTISEGVSIQSMTITLQGFRKEHLDWQMILRSMRTELVTAALLGAACGLLVGVVSWAWKHNGIVASAIGASIFLTVVTACLLGIVLPAVVHRLKGNPRIASGPLVLACADVATLLLYFNLSGLILR
jgi:magnesium transporter